MYGHTGNRFVLRPCTHQHTRRRTQNKRIIACNAQLGGGMGVEIEYSPTAGLESKLSNLDLTSKLGTPKQYDDVTFCFRSFPTIYKIQCLKTQLDLKTWIRTGPLILWRSYDNHITRR